MPIQAQSADGVLHEFPDGTDGAVIDRVMKTYATTPQGVLGGQIAQLQQNVKTLEAAPALSAPQQSNGPDIGRDLALGARDVANGAVGGLYNLTSGALNLVTSPFTDKPIFGSFNDLADSVGAPQPKTDGERYLGAAISGASSALPFMGLGALAEAGQAAPILKGLTANPVGQVVSGTTSSVAAQGASDATGGNPWATMLAGIAGGFGPTIGEAAFKGAVRGGEAGRQAVQGAISDFGAAGASPTVAQATGSSRLGAIESLASRAPGSASAFRDKSLATADAIGGTVANIADGNTMASAGRVIQKAIPEFVDRFQTKAGALYNAVDQYIPEATPVSVSNTQGVLAKLTNPTPGAAAISDVLKNPKISSIAQAVETDTGNHGTLPYSALKDLRSQVGSMLSGSELVSGAPRAQASQLYAGLTEDMKLAAQSAGPDALNAFNRATQFYKSGIGRIDGTLQRFSAIADPERLSDAILRADDKSIWALRRSVQPNEWANLARAKAGVLGQATAGNQNAAGNAFSTDTFLTNYSKLGESAQNALFGNIAGAPSMASDLRSIARTAERIKTTNRILANPSGTAASIANMTAGAAIMGALAHGDLRTAGTVAGSVGAANAGARLMTSPTVVRFLARTTEVPVERLPALLSRLAQMGQSDPDAKALSDKLSAAGLAP